MQSDQVYAAVWYKVRFILIRLKYITWDSDTKKGVCVQGEKT